MKISLLLGVSVAFFSSPSSAALDIADGAPVLTGIVGLAAIPSGPNASDMPGLTAENDPTTVLASVSATLVPGPRLAATVVPAPLQGSIPAEKHAARRELSLPMGELHSKLENGAATGELPAAAEADFMKRLGAGWRSDSFEGDDGAAIQYDVRPGQGPAVLFVHGRSVGGESFDRWADAFPGRPLMILQRRGYNGSQTGQMELGSVYRMNSSDIDRAIAVAQKLGQDQKPGVVVYSLSAMLLPALDPARVAWLALLNPGVYGMIRHMPAETMFSASALLGAYINSFWNPFMAASVGVSATAMTEDVVKRLRAAAGEKYVDFGRHLIALLSERARTPSWKDVLVKESLWATFGAKPAGYLASKIPLFLGLSDDDEVVPKATLQELIAELRQSPRPIRIEKRPGTHLSFVFEPESIIPALHEFDRSVSGKNLP